MRSAIALQACSACAAAPSARTASSRAAPSEASAARAARSASVDAAVAPSPGCRLRRGVPPPPLPVHRALRRAVPRSAPGAACRTGMLGFGRASPFRQFAHPAGRHPRRAASSPRVPRRSRIAARCAPHAHGPASRVPPVPPHPPSGRRSARRAQPRPRRAELRGRAVRACASRACARRGLRVVRSTVRCSILASMAASRAAISAA